MTFQRLTPSAAALSIITGLLAALLTPQPALAQSIQRVIATVNDEPITAYDLSQRAKFTAATTNRRVTQALSTQVLQQLIGEKLQMQAAKRDGVTISDEEVKAALNGISKRNKVNLKALTAYLKSRGVRIKTLENKIRTELAWSNVIRKKFDHLVSVGESDIKLHMSKNDKDKDGKDGKESTTVYELQKLLLQFSQGRTEHEVKTRMDEAEKLRASFKTCRRWRAQAKLYRNVKATFGRDITPDKIKEPLRSVIDRTPAGKVTPPTVQPAGIEIVAVCNRKEQDGSSGRRASLVSQLKNQQFTQFSQRHLRDLRRDAVIEYPNQTGKNPYALKPSAK